MGGHNNRHLIGWKVSQSDSSSQKNSCPTMLIAAVFIIVSNWKQTTCPKTEEWITNMLYLHNGTLLSCYEKLISGICRQMVGNRKKHILSKISQSQEDK
jgi:hypothetical protein